MPMAPTLTLAETPPHSGPHAGRDGLLLFAHRVRIDGRNFEDGVAHPLRQHMQGDALVDGIDGIAMAEALGDTVGAFRDVRLLHHGHHASPRGGTGPGPQGLIQCAPAGAPLDFFEAVHHVERVQQDRRHGHRSVHTFAAFFQAFHDDHLVSKIHPPGCEVERFGDTAPGVIEDATKGTHRPIRSEGGAEERLALSWGKVKAPPKRIIEISRVMHSATGYKNSVTIARPTSAEVATQTMTAPRRRAGQMRRFAPVWGGECCTLRPILKQCAKALSRTPLRHEWERLIDLQK